MEYIVLIFKLAIAFNFLLAGLSKIAYVKISAQKVADMGIFPPKIGKVMGTVMPFIEIILGITLVLSKYNLWVNLFALFIITFFILLNLKGIFDHMNVKCFCFGNLLESKIGYGALFHFLYLLVLLIPNFIWDSVLLGKFISQNSSLYIFLLILTSIVLCFLGLMIRQIILITRDI